MAHLSSPAAIYKSFDLRRTPREAIVEEVRKLEKTHFVQVSTGHDQMCTLSAIPRTVEVVNKQFHPDHLFGEAQFAKNVHDALTQVNAISNNEPNLETKVKPMSITNAGQLGQQFRTLLGEVKAQLAKATEDMNGAMTELKDTTDQAVGMVKQVKSETADLKAALGLNSNNPPT